MICSKPFITTVLVCMNGCYFHCLSNSSKDLSIESSYLFVYLSLIDLSKFVNLKCP